jgi:hypothetical protein
MLIKKLGALMLTLSVLSFGCASAPKVANMALPKYSNTGQFTNKTIHIKETTGGSKTSKITGISKVDDNVFDDVLRRTVKDVGLFSNILDTDSADYSLQAVITSQKQPALGFNMTASLDVQYYLIDKNGGATVYEKLIQSSYTAEMADAFVATTRVRMANEGAVRENLTELVNDLATWSKTLAP